MPKTFFYPFYTSRRRLADTCLQLPESRCQLTCVFDVPGKEWLRHSKRNSGSVLDAFCSYLLATWSVSKLSSPWVSQVLMNHPDLVLHSHTSGSRAAASVDELWNMLDSRIVTTQNDLKVSPSYIAFPCMVPAGKIKGQRVQVRLDRSQRSSYLDICSVQTWGVVYTCTPHHLTRLTWSWKSWSTLMGRSTMRSSRSCTHSFQYYCAPSKEAAALPPRLPLSE